MKGISLKDRIEGALYGIAIGDGMGAPVEGWSSSRILEQFTDHNMMEFLPATHGKDPATGKGHGRITDDTLMTEALIRAYCACKDHMNAYDYEKFFLPEILSREIWIPEKQKTMALFGRLFWPEKYPVIRMTINGAEPRSAGIGNMVNVGVAMYMMPIGAVNAGDPKDAYEEATSFGLAHNESFALEAAGIMAAAYASAFSNNSTIRGVIETTLSLSHDGTFAAIQAVDRAVEEGDDTLSFVQKARQAVSPFDQRTTHAVDEQATLAGEHTDVGRPSRIYTAEEVPVALGALKTGEGNFIRTLKASVFYGRDCDSIASMACGLFGAIYGRDDVPDTLKKASETANRRSYTETASELTSVVWEIFQKDKTRFAERQKIMNRN